MTYVGQKDLRLEIARGNISGYDVVDKFGRNPDIDSGSGFEDVWDGGGTWVAPTTARTHDIVSTSTNDDGSPAGTGAQTITIYGLDASGDEISESVTMNGTSNVATANTYTMIHRMAVTAAGSGGSNAGTITATAQTDATVTAQINTGLNQTLMAIYQIPNNKIGYMTNYFCSFNNDPSGAAIIRLFVQPNGEVFQTKHVIGVVSSGQGSVQHQFDPPLGDSVFDEFAIIKMQGNSDADNSDISAGFSIIIIDK